jgi:hypothetical protein
MLDDTVPNGSKGDAMVNAVISSAVQSVHVLGTASVARILARASPPLDEKVKTRALIFMDPPQVVARLAQQRGGMTVFDPDDMLSGGAMSLAAKGWFVTVLPEFSDVGYLIADRKVGVQFTGLDDGNVRLERVTNANRVARMQEAFDREVSRRFPNARRS